MSTVYWSGLEFYRNGSAFIVYMSPHPRDAYRFVSGIDSTKFPYESISNFIETAEDTVISSLGMFLYCCLAFFCNLYYRIGQSHEL